MTVFLVEDRLSHIHHVFRTQSCAGPGQRWLCRTMSAGAAMHVIVKIIDS